MPIAPGASSTVTILVNTQSAMPSPPDPARPRAARALPHQQHMAEQIRQAEQATASGALAVHVEGSRQLIADLLEADRCLRQMNPWIKSIGTRLRAHANNLLASIERAEDETRRLGMLTQQPPPRGAE